MIYSKFYAVSKYVQYTVCTVRLNANVGTRRNKYTSLRKLPFTRCIRTVVKMVLKPSYRPKSQGTTVVPTPGEGSLFRRSRQDSSGTFQPIVLAQL